MIPLTQYTLEGAGTLGEFVLAVSVLAGVVVAVFVLGSVFDRIF